MSFVGNMYKYEMFERISACRSIACQVGYTFCERPLREMQSDDALLAGCQNIIATTKGASCELLTVHSNDDNMGVELR